MRKKLHIILTIFSLTLVSCDKYLNVTPKSSISEDQIFESEIGFQQALSGIYSQLATASLYGDRLSLGFVSALAQNYNMTDVGAPYKETTALNYGSDEVKQHLKTIWGSSYNAIAGINNLLNHTKSERSVLSNSNYALYRGEALGLRAYIHFDLVRLFGTHPSLDAPSIPYETTVDNYATVPSTTKEIINYVLEDLKEAATLLSTVDEGGNMQVASRQIKMNYYAVKALEARVRLYMGDKSGAFEAASIVVNAEHFPFIDVTKFPGDASVRDRLFKSELVFAIRSRFMQNWVDGYFRYKLRHEYCLKRSKTDIENVLFEGIDTDVRRKSLFEIEGNDSHLYPSKFWQTYVLTTNESMTSNNRLDQLVPLIRISEMYYILAETASSVSDGVAYLNKVRNSRSILPLSESAINTEALLNAEILKEYQKEFYAEGQLFFYYKRKQSIAMQFRVGPILSTSYVLPIPEDELEYNPNY